MRVRRFWKKIFLVPVGALMLIVLHFITMDYVEIVTFQMKDRNFSIQGTYCVSKVNNSVTPIKISKGFPSWKELHNTPWSKNIKDGLWKPNQCNSEQSLAIIIPYRNREVHLKKLLHHLHPFLQRQTVEYQIIVVEQSSKGIFNKGALINVGIKEALLIKNNRFNCFIIHDVDMIPIMDNNIYQCADNPFHLGAAVDKFNFYPLYPEIVGGVLALTKTQLDQVNGFSNVYEGWGAEDDDMTERIRQEKLKIVRYSLNVGKYIMIKHHDDKGNPSNEDRGHYLKGAWRRYKVDGLNTIYYSKLNNTHRKSNLVHWVLVDLPEKSYFIKPDF